MFYEKRYDIESVLIHLYIQEMILNVSTTNFETQCDCTFKYNYVIYLHFRL